MSHVTDTAIAIARAESRSAIAKARSDYRLAIIEAWAMRKLTRDVEAKIGGYARIARMHYERARGEVQLAAIELEANGQDVSAKWGTERYPK